MFVCLLFVLSFSGGGRCLSWLGAKSKCSYCTFRFSQSGWLFITVSTDNSEKAGYSTTLNTWVFLDTAEFDL